ncbi:hypothetical protein [Spirillospora sp. NPDC029432]|uniref:hypothetical protein n=1 Tax=Spirillospora sp. NPDC029432 TaxID=3154599 RepID=UPI0034527676
MRFARCLRDNGVDVPDPKPGQDFRMELPKQGDTKKLQGAMEKCRHFLEATGKVPDLNDPETRDKLVRFARCARENGIDIPDPVGEDGLKGIMGKVSREQLEKARELCGHLLPGRNG